MDPFIVLSTKRPELNLQIDGVSYEVPLPEQFRFREMLRFQEARKRLAHLQAELGKDDLPAEGIEAAESEMQKLLDDITGLILRKVPDGVRAKLTDWEKFALLGTYTQALEKLGFFQKETEKTKGESPSPGQSGSGASADSMAEPASPGSIPQS